MAADGSNRKETGAATRRLGRQALAAGMPMLALLTLAGCSVNRSAAPPEPAAKTGKADVAAEEAFPGEASRAEVERFCGSGSGCHAMPPPETLPRSEWRQRVHNGYKFLKDFNRTLTPAPAPADQVIRYYEFRAPDELPLLEKENAVGPPPVGFDRSEYVPPGQRFPRVTNVNLVHLFHPTRQDLLVCDARYHQLVALRPYIAPGNKDRVRVLAKIPGPAHTEVADLDRDGVKDILVADLGDVYPSDHKLGRVIWLKGKPNGTFTPIVLLKNVGRVTDVQAADFDGDGDQDVMAAVFGWRHVGGVMYLENRTTNWSKPTFVPRVIDKRTGAIHIPLTDLNGDGRPDFIALFAQEHEKIVAFLNEGGGKFRKETIHDAKDPSYGSSGIQLADMDGDSDLDVLYTNGDVFDFTFLRPDNSIQWLENRGTFPFVHHPVTRFYGVHRAQAIDMDGDKDLDIVAASFLPEPYFPQRKAMGLDSLILMEQTAPGKFTRHSLGTVTCDYPTLVAGDVNGDNRPDIVTGSFWFGAKDPMDTVTMWINRGNIPQSAKVSQAER